MEATTFEAVPQAAGSMGSLQRKIDWRGAFWVASGVPALVLFSIGAIAATAHVETDRFVALIHALKQGRLGDARAIWQRLVPLIETMRSSPHAATLEVLPER